MENSSSRVNQEVEIDLLKLLKLCLKRWWVFVLVVGLCGTLGFLYSKFMIEPTYQSTVQIYVHNSSIDSDSTSVTKSDLDTSTQIVKLYEALLNTDDTLDAVKRKAGIYYYDYSQLKGMIATASVNSTQIFKVTVTSTDPQEAYKLADTIGEVLPDKIKDIIPGTDAMVVSHAKVNETKVAPSNSKNAVIAATIGFVITFAIIFVRMLLDVEIHDENDLLEIVDLPILANLPTIGEAGKANKKNAKNGYYQQASERGE